jgi:hypothetical protein
MKKSELKSIIKEELLREFSTDSHLQLKKEYPYISNRINDIFDAVREIKDQLERNRVKKILINILSYIK